MIDHFLQYLDTLRGVAEGPPRQWLADVRLQGRNLLEAARQPTIKDEDWRFTDLATFPQDQLRPHQPDRSLLTTLTAAEHEVLAGAVDAQASIPIIFINGFFTRGSPGPDTWPAGINVSEIDAVAPYQGKELARLVAKSSLNIADPFLVFNQAMMQNGIRLELKEGFCTDKPIHIIYLYTSAAAGMVSSPRNFIVAGPRTRTTLLETTIWTDNVFCLDNIVKHLVVAEGAELEHAQYWQGTDTSYAMSHTEAILYRGAKYRTLVINGGGALSRNNLGILLHEPNASIESTGVYGLAGKGQVDNYSRIEHQGSDTSSRQLYKGMLAGKSRGVFRGCIKVARQVKGADASQLNKNILLGRGARAHSMPWLEIDASDIRCEHGSTTGTIDPEQLFYLTTRGIPANQARKLLLRAFIAEVLANLKEPWLKEKIDGYCDTIFGQMISSHFDAGKEEGGQ